ncbi:MAG TPA: PIN domain-containing protein [Rhizomicrobium sp.]
MSGRPFLDTNVLVYAFTADDPRNEDATDLLMAGGIISVQVLNEFVNVSRRKHQRDWNEIAQSLETLKTLLLPPLPLTMDLHAKGMEIAKTYRFKFYDSLIVAAAISAGCDDLFTEDLHHGQKIGGLTVRNPFRP